MPAPGRKIFGFLKGSKHRRSSTKESGEEVEQANVKLNQPSYEEDAQLESQPEPDIVANDSHEDDNYLGRDEDSALDPAGGGSAFSSRSINLKPTTATLAETFSSGGFQEVIDYVESREESVEVENSEFYYSDPDYEHTHQGGSYTEFVNGTEEEETDTLDYTDTGHDAPYISDDHSDTLAAHHQRKEYNSLVVGLEHEHTEWEETSLGYETCSRTLNTNLEGINFVPDHSVIHHQPTPPTVHTRMTTNAALSAHTRISANTGFSNHSEIHSQLEVEPQFYYEEEGYDQYQESYGAEGYYYDDEGQLVASSYPEGDGEFVDDLNTIANSTIATEGLSAMDQPVFATDMLPSQLEDDEDSAYESEESSSSWDDEETRDMSLLDEEGESVIGDNNGAGEDEDDDEESDSDSDSDSDDESQGGRGRARGPRIKSMMQIINELKHCSLKGSSVSYDDDEEDDDEDLPDVAQISTGATSMTSMTNSFDDGNGGGRPKKQKPRRTKTDRNLDILFNKVSTLGQELLGDVGDDLGLTTKKKKKGKKSLRRRERDPAARIVDSLRDIFNCGHPKHY